jgi:hypothetical protein
MAWNLAGLLVTAVKAAATSSPVACAVATSSVIPFDSRILEDPVDIRCKIVKVDVWDCTLEEREGEQVGVVCHFDRLLAAI